MLKHLLPVVAGLLYSGLITAQTVSGNEAKRYHPDAVEVRLDNRSSAPASIMFDESSFISASSGPDALLSILGGGQNDALRLVRTDRDELGMSHQRYQQLYRQVPVVTGEYLLHEKQGRIVSANGLFYTNLQLNTQPRLSEEEALTSAMNAVGGKKYLWQASMKEQEILYGHAHDGSAPEGKLVILPSLGHSKEQQTALCWKFDIYSLEPHERWNVYVNAENGKIEFRENRICNITVNGSAVTKYSGTQTLQTDSIAPGSYRLRDYSRGGGVETWDLNNGTSYAGAVDFTDTDNLWNTTTNQDNAAYDAHWGTQKTYDYFLGVHGRNSYNNAGAVLKSYIHYSSGYNNAFWNGSVMTYGDGDGNTFSPLTEMDIVAHELTHGVTEYSSSLIYSYQSGALNESFSDIFGVTVDFFARPGQANWTMADQSYTPTGSSTDGIRYMNNPNLAGNPDTYLGAYWYTGTGDNGGVHYNSGVQNFWYYLLCVGGSGTNDNGFAYNVSAIGMNKARMIAYRNNSFYLTSGSQYADAAFYSLKSANDLYGPCSPEALAVKNAWDAVGVYGLTLNINATASVSGTPCAGGAIQLNATGGTSYSWTGPGGYTSNLQNPIITNAGTANNGTYTCVVTDASGCSGSATVNVSVNAAPSVSVSGADSICEGESRQLTAIASVPGQGGNNGNNATALPIPDAPAAGVTSSITISGSSNASALIAVTIDSLIHTWDADLKIELLAPNGSVITLANGAGSSGDNFIRTRFVPTGNNIANGAAPFTGSFAPATPFSSLSGFANGQWSLRITDLASQDIGTLYKWSIELPGNSITSYNWTPSTGLNNAGISNPLASPSSTTLYTLTVTDNNGCSAVTTANVSVSSLAVSPAVTTVGCPGTASGSINLNITGASGNTTIQWSNGSTAVNNQGLAAGTYTYTVTDGAGCIKSGSAVVTSSLPLQLNATATDAGCGAANGSVTLSVSGGTPPFTYQWSNGSTAQNLSSVGAGTYTVVVTDAKLCTATASATVNSGGGSTPAVPGSITGTKTGNCAGTQRTFSCPNVSGASSYSWSVPTGTSIISGQGTKNIVLGFQTGFTSGTLSVRAVNSCGSSSPRTATIRSVPALPGVISGPSKNLCNSTSNYSIVPSTTGATSYTWSVPAGVIILNGQGTTAIEVQWPSSGIVSGSVCVTANNTCGSSSARCLSSVTTAPSRPASITGPASVCANQQGVAYSVPSEPLVSYTWTAPAGAIIASGQGTSSVIVNYGSGGGILKVVPSNVCGKASNRSLTINISCREDEYTNTLSAALSPNPGNGRTRISFNGDPGRYVVTVSDILGRVIQRSGGNSATLDLDLSTHMAGLYFVGLQNEMGYRQVLRLVIE